MQHATFVRARSIEPNAPPLTGRGTENELYEDRLLVHVWAKGAPPRMWRGDHLMVVNLRVA